MDDRVLIVDDDQAALRLLKKYVQRSGCEVLTAQNGCEALRILLAEAPPILLTDWMMPEMDGLDLCRAVRSHEGIGFVYVIMITGRTEEDEVVEAFEAGADDYLSKPVNRKELLARLRAGQRIAALQQSLDRRTQELHLYNARMAVASDRLGKANEKLQKAATTDELTGLLNRRAAMARLAEHWAASNRQGGWLSCILLDIDHFKSFNDRSGHAVGDLVLKETARNLQQAVRSEEAVCRIGGEEFLVLSPHSTARMAARGAERLRAAVEAHRVPCGTAELRVTVSAGVAERTREMTSPDDLLKAADEAMYAAKRSGRNRVCVAGVVPVDATAAAGVGRETDGDRAQSQADGTILVATTDAGRRAMARQILEDQGFAVREATDGAGVLTAAREAPPDVIVLGALAGESDELECMQHLRMDGPMAEAPVILLIEEGSGTTVEAGLEAGAAACLCAPIRPRELAMRVAWLARFRRSHAELALSHEVRGEQARIMVALLQHAREIASADDLDTLLESTVQAAAELTYSRRACVLLPDPEGKVLKVRRSTELQGRAGQRVRVPVESGLVGEVFRTRQPVVINDAEDAFHPDPQACGAVFGGTPWLAVALTASEQVIGVLVIADRHGSQPFTPWDLECVELLTTVAGPAIHGFLARQSLDEARDSIVVALAKLAEHRDTDTGRHLDRVTRFSLVLANELRVTGQYADTITDAFLRDLERAVPLHDIGKVAIPDRILFKPGPLTADEMAIMRTHAAIGAQAIHALVERVPGAAFLRMAEEIAHGHHEWYNGEGYPKGVSGPDIPLTARIAALADVYDAVTTKRVYKEAMPHSRAAAIVREGCGTQFDPLVVQAFVNREEGFARLAAELADAEPAEPTRAEPAPVLV